MIGCDLPARHTASFVPALDEIKPDVIEAAKHGSSIFFLSSLLLAPIMHRNIITDKSSPGFTYMYKLL